jgi:hypothetical protein
LANREEYGMKRKALSIALVVFSLFFIISGCDQVKELLGFGAPSPPPPGVQPSPPGTQPTTSPPGQPGSPPAEYGPTTPSTPPSSLSCCVITNFQVGILSLDEYGNYSVFETNTIPYVPGTYLGVAFNYQSNTGRPIQYVEEEYFPYPPQNWTLWEGSEGSYKIYPEENRAVYTTLLTPDSETFVSYWGFNPSGDPLGQWVWDIYFDGEYYTRVTFNVVPQ